MPGLVEDCCFVVAPACWFLGSVPEGGLPGSAPGAGEVTVVLFSGDVVVIPGAAID